MQRLRWIAGSMATLSAVLLVVAGCGKRDDDSQKSGDSRPVANVEGKKDNQGKTIQAQPVGRVNSPKSPTFADAVIQSDNPPEDEMRPPNQTYTGKNSVKIYEMIANDLWNKTGFADAEGKPIRYRAIIATSLGDIHVDLLGDIAPNHVRSFVCLAKAGYYDGMTFYYTPNRQVEDGRVALIETGCPRGSGEVGSGSIGYWLKPEMSSKLTHDEGVLGACLNKDPNSAACRFYITAANMPVMDGQYTIFAKVTKGLDVVRTINKREVLEFDRPKEPVQIKSVTIQSVSQ